LTGREIEIAILVALGLPNKQIASHLNISDISEWTVSTHLRRIFTKLQVNNRAAMVYHCSVLIPQNIAQSS
jgi:DNA-binding NarL/FixJ family response regulator